MGGFEGGDEGGFWDIDILPSLIHQQNASKPVDKAKFYIEKSGIGYSTKAQAKAKTTGHDGSTYVEDLYDTISFVPCKCNAFTIEGCDDIPLESNTIYKAFNALNDFTNEPDILDFFFEHKVVVTKRIPVLAGYGGASSDAASFIHLVKEVCNLILTRDELDRIARIVGPKVPSFI